HHCGGRLKRLLVCLALVILGSSPVRADVSAPPTAASTVAAADGALALTRTWLAAMKAGDAAAFARAVQPPLRVVSAFETCFPAQPHALRYEQTLSDAAARDRWFQCMIADGKKFHVGFPSILHYVRPDSEVVKPRKLSKELRDVVARVESGATVVE